MGIDWFDEIGLYNLTLNYERLTNLKKPPCVRGWGSHPPTYSIKVSISVFYFAILSILFGYVFHR